MNDDTLLREAAAVKAASREVGLSSVEVRNQALEISADLLESHTAALLEANAEDVEAARGAGVSETVIDRLRLDAPRVTQMADGLRQVAGLPDPLGEVLDGWRRPNGLEIRQVRVPLGVVAVIYENRPNVTSDAAALCLKSGNAAFLRGSSAAARSNRAVADLLSAGCEKAGLARASVTLVSDPSRESATRFMQLRGYIDCLVPRGGPSLISAIEEHATVPYVIDGAGNCHVYVHASADLGMAAEIVANGKTQRPSVCNATETLLVDREVAEPLLEDLLTRLDGVSLETDPTVGGIVSTLAERLGAISAIEAVRDAAEEDWGTEHLALVLSVKVVDGVEQAIEHIARYGTGHTEAIVTTDRAIARRFQREVDAAAVVVNASTRFTDGEEYGFGAEIGISTQKLHARGPMGLAALTTYKYLVDGDGQIRG